MPPRRKLVRLSPPHRGIVEGLAYEDHDPSSTVDAQNVRGHDPATGRLRLSQRPGMKNKASAAPAANQKAEGGGAIQNIATLTLTDTSPEVVGPESVIIKADGTPQVIDNSSYPPALLSGTTPITGEDYQFSVFDKDGSLYVVTIDQTADSGTYAKKIRKFPRPYTSGTLLSAYNETSLVKGRQVLGYALHEGVLFIWWNGVVSSDGEETVTTNRISDGARVDNSGKVITDLTNYFLKSGGDPADFEKANGTGATVDGKIKNLMSASGGLISLVAGLDGTTGTALHIFGAQTGQKVRNPTVLGSGETQHKRYDSCVDVRGRMYAVTSYDDSGGSRVFRLSSAPRSTGLTWHVESVNSSGTVTNVGNMSSVAIDDWGEETLVYVAGEGMKNSSWVKFDADNDYDVSASSNDRHNLVLFEGESGKVINGGSILDEMDVTHAGDVDEKIRVTVPGHNLSDGDRVYIKGQDTPSNRDEVNTDDSAPNLTYVKRIDADTLELYEDKGLTTKQDETGVGVAAVSGVTLQDVSEIGIIRSYNGINRYTGGNGGFSFGWNRARSNYAHDTYIKSFIRILTDIEPQVSTSRINATYLEKRVTLSGSRQDMTTVGDGTSAIDMRLACNPHAVPDYRREREQLITVTSGGATKLFTDVGGFVGDNKNLVKEFNYKFFSVEYSKFVDSGLVKGPYSLVCDGYGYRLLEWKPHQFHSKVWSELVSAGSMPTDSGHYAKLIANWRGRIVLSGVKSDPTNWYMSAYGNPLDWDYFPSVTVETQAVAGNNSSAGRNPDIINSIVPYSDDLLLFGGDKTIWQMTGDPMSGGRLDKVSGGTGMAWGRPWAIAPNGSLFFFGSRGGVFSMIPSAQGPQQLGAGSLDYELANIDLYENQIFMEWSNREQGLYVFVCPNSPVDSPSSYFWDSRSNAWWKDTFPQGMAPSFVTTIDGDRPDDREILIGACNGGVYSLSESTGDDDGTEISSHAFIGPITTGTEGLVAIDEMQYILPTSGNPVSYSIHVGDTVKGAVESSSLFTGNLVAGDNPADRRRAVGRNIFLKVHNKSGEKKPWSLEGVNVYARVMDSRGRK